MIIIEILLLLTSFFPIYHLFAALRKDRQKDNVKTIEHSFTILVPCYNESICINKTIEALTKLKYNNFEVIFINDGSTDNTLSIIDTELSLVSMGEHYSYDYYQSRLISNFFCIDKPNSGKALSLNTGIHFSRNEIIITLDADSILNEDCLCILNDAFSDKNVVAAGGSIHIIQAKNHDYIKSQSLIKRMLIKLQSIDYLKGFFIYKLSLSRQNALAIISGAFGAFKKSVLMDVGCFRKSLGEDIDITLKIQKYIANTSKKIVYLPNAKCYTECPERLSDLYRQRIRWQKGFIDCVVHHSKFLLSTCFKNSLSFYMIFEAVCIGIFSSILPALTKITLAATGNFLSALYISMFCAVVNIIYSSCAYIISARYSYPYKKKYPLSILVDIFLLKPFLALIYVVGTIGYLKNKSDWKKTKRSVMLANN